MANYCCFNCPQGDYESNKLTDKCPNCGEKYGFPLFNSPNYIGEFEVVEPINRGFYGAAYKVVNKLKQEKVLKVSPKKIYNHFGKNFEEECLEHAEVAESNPHIVQILDYSEEEIQFQNNTKLVCHVVVQNYIEGPTLKEILERKNAISATKIAQIAIDLFRILESLKNKGKNHNDLHAENIIIQKLDKTIKRADEVDNFTKAIAIDLGSLSEINKSGDAPSRKGDAHWVADFLIDLSKRLLAKPEEVNDLNYRLANLLEDRAKLLFPDTGKQRLPDYNEFIEHIKSAFYQQAHPWENPLELRNINDSYNAQTLDPWFVPSLLVDPDDQWLNHISGKGPLVISGMRGCGKTMMLRALQFHARAFAAKEAYSNTDLQIEQLEKEKYIGLYVSCNRLLDEIGTPSEKNLHEPFSRIIVLYGIEAIKALRHLKTIDETQVKGDFYKEIAEAISNLFNNGEKLDDIRSDIELEQRLIEINSSLNRGESDYTIKVNPANAFPQLADAITNCSPVWNNHHVLFLLDDVSTRFLHINNIEKLLSSLIFQSEKCSFKITSEVQTIEYLLHSPGNIEKAKRGRDFEVFDLGAAVNEKIRNKGGGGGKKFVENILKRRIKYNSKHPDISPSEILGDKSLNDIAKHIVTRGKNKTSKKKIYHGLSALAGVCIGDIGDIIYLYDMIMRNYEGETPIPKTKQNDCFNDLCSMRLQEINKKESYFKDYALSFAKAAHELLKQSAKNDSSRLRQYYSIYVRITTGDMQSQYEKIRELVDAGIFVYSGMSDTPRTLGNDTNPINQFKLTYRRLYGISNLIGLSQADRFELSGENLRNWINNPSNGKEILVNSVGSASTNLDEGDQNINIDYHEEQEFETSSGTQKNLFEGESKNIEDTRYNEKKFNEFIKNKAPSVYKVGTSELQSTSIDTLVTALGFEQSALASVEKVLKFKPYNIILIQYEESGKSKEILELVSDFTNNFEIIDFENAKTSLSIPDGNILCNISGMSKSIIFNSIRNSLKNNKEVWVSHTLPEKTYPLNSDIKKILNEDNSEDIFTLLDNITEELLKGEEGPYEALNLLLSDSDHSKRRVLIGYLSSKYEKLFNILENREFDSLQIFTPSKNNYRSKLAILASEVVSKKYPNSKVHKFNSDDLLESIKTLTKLYKEYYIDQNYNFEIALTGSKLQAMSAAIISAAFKISNCWYIKPKKWNTDKFSKGVGKTNYYKIEI